MHQWNDAGREGNEVWRWRWTSVSYALEIKGINFERLLHYIIHNFKRCIFYAPEIEDRGGILILSCLSFCSLWNFNLANNFWTVSARALIFQMNIPCDKTFLWVPLSFNISFHIAHEHFLWQDLPTGIKIIVLVTLTIFGIGHYRGHLCFTNTSCLTLEKCTLHKNMQLVQIFSSYRYCRLSINSLIFSV